MRSMIRLGSEIGELIRLAYVSENWEKRKYKNVTTRDVIKEFLHSKSKLINVLSKYVKSLEIDENNFTNTVLKAIKQGVAIIPADDDEYPNQLREYGYGEKVYPPLVLYRLGKPIPNKPMVAVVGTRNPSNEGRRLAYELSKELANNGYVIVTGFAPGIDSEAVHGAVEAGGHVVGVLPCLYEDGNLTRLMRTSKILDELVKSGYDNFTVISEHLFKDNKSKIKKWFALRNRIISGMSILIVIPETRYKNNGWGTRYQVEYGIKAGREVLIMEPRVNDNDVRRGFEYFIREGAKPVSTIDDVLKRLKEKQGSKEGIGRKTLDEWL